MTADSASGSRRDLGAAIGLFLIVASLYALASPGRIDTIDGQFRYEAAKNWYEKGIPEIDDPVLVGGTFAGLEGRRFTAYNAPGCLFGIPFIALADLAVPRNEEVRRFAFGFVSPALGAALAALTFLFFRRLGIGRRSAIGWSLAASTCTLLWPVASSAFDQVQHAFFLTLAAFLAFVAAERKSLVVALAGGLSIGVAIMYQETYSILAPLLGIVCFAKGEGWKRGFGRYVAFGFGAATGLALWAWYNYFRTGQLMVENRFGFGTLHPPLWGNPLDGALSLLVSPGRGVLFFSPLIVLAIAGIRPLHRRAPFLAWAICAAAVVHFSLISSFSFFSAEWCWGPRYLVVVLALLHVGLPFAPPLRRRLLAVFLTIGCAVQLLGLSLEMSRYHYEHRHLKYFWANRPFLYFRESQLAARPLEILNTLFAERPEPKFFRPGPHPDQMTWAIQGVGDRSRPETWVPYFKVFYLPRPWPIWMASLPKNFRFIAVGKVAGLLVAAGAVGAFLILTMTRKRAVQGPDLLPAQRVDGTAGGQDDE
ncbi:MAG: hypothetical protein ABIV06_07940 [Thermoanaerobaculia bacterium]